MSNPSESNRNTQPPRPVTGRNRANGAVNPRRVPAIDATRQPGAAHTPHPASDASATRVLPAQRHASPAAETTSPSRPAPGRPHGAADVRRQPEGDARHAGARSASDRPGRGVKIALGATVGAIAIVYVGGVAAFSNICYPGARIAGADVSFMGASDAASTVERALGGYELKVTGLGFQASWTPAEGAFSIDALAEAQSVISSNEPLIWPVRLARSLASAEQDEDGSVRATFDEEDLAATIGSAVDAFNEGRAGTFDAAGAYDAESGTFTVATARSNQRLDKDAVISACADAVEHASDTAQIDESAYEPLAGGASDDELQAACDAANQIIGVDVDLTMGGQTVGTLDGATMTQWITFDDELSPTLDHEALAAWIRDLAVSNLDTAGSQRTYTRPDGKTITVSGGTYGWISDEAALAELIQTAVAEKQTGTIEVPTKQTADLYAGVGARDWGAYVDVDLTEQHVRYYDANDNLIWESGCITGNPNHNNQTPEGIYFINSNSGGALLVGADENKDGEPDYKTPVDYWMSFIGGAVGLHDASWQAASSFSDPTAYTRVGSHGCVNLPPEKAAELHELLHVGVCVITHS